MSRSMRKIKSSWCAWLRPVKRSYQHADLRLTPRKNICDVIQDNSREKNIKKKKYVQIGAQRRELFLSPIIDSDRFKFVNHTGASNRRHKKIMPANLLPVDEKIYTKSGCAKSSLKILDLEKSKLMVTFTNSSIAFIKINHQSESALTKNIRNIRVTPSNFVTSHDALCYHLPSVVFVS